MSRPAPERQTLGDPEAACPWCQAPATATASACGRLVIYHPPTDCCEQRRAHAAKPRQRRAPAKQERPAEPEAAAPPVEPRRWWLD